MLSGAYNASDMLDELRAAEDWFEPFFSFWEDEMLRYHGPGWRNDTDQGVYNPENFDLEWVSLMVPQCVFGNPRVRVKTNRLGEQRVVAKGHELALNRWIRDTRCRALNEKLAVDFGHRWAVVLTLPGWEEGVSEFEDPRRWPTVKRISPRRFRWDPVAIEWEEARWYGHKTIHDKEDLESRAEANPDEGWNLERIRSLTEGQGLDELRNRATENRVPDRGEVVLWHIYLPEYKPTDADLRQHGRDAWNRTGVRGAWLTLGVGQDAEGEERAEWVRVAYPYWGRRRGPYSLIQCYLIPDETGGLSPIKSVHGQTKELNEHARSMSRAMLLYKKGILVDGTDPDWEDKIREFEDHWVVALEGLDEIDKKVKEVELGGATELHIVHERLLRDRVQRSSGISEAMQGRPREDVTATAEQTAVEAANTRTGFQIHKFRDGVADYLEAVSWYLFFDEVEVELGPEAAGVFVDEVTGRPIERPVYHGGAFEESDEERQREDEDLWESFGMEIEPYSMERTSEALVQRRMLDFAQTLGFMVPMMAQFPFVIWDDVIEFIGEGMNMPNFGDFFDMETLAEFREMLMGAMLEGRTGSAGPQPRYARDLGPSVTSPPAFGSLGGRGPSTPSALGALLGQQTGPNIGAGQS